MANRRCGTSRLRTRVGLALVTAAALVSLAGAAQGAPVPGTAVLYTSDADFDQGTLVNVNHDPPNANQLQLNQASGTFPFVWVALSQRCTIAKVHTQTGAILGEYRTVSDGAGCNQSSRTTVALDGSVWVGHRGPGGVTHVGLVELNQCVDRDASGTIETSTGYGDVKPWPGSGSVLASAEDECILHHVDTDALGFSDSRHMSVDRNNKLWVGDYAGGSKFVRINGGTGAVETPVRDHACGGYGGLIDANGVIWSAGGNVLRWDPDAPDSDTNPRCIAVPNYGVAVDPSGWIWLTDLGGNVRKVSPDGNTILGPFAHGASNAQGLAVTPDGDVWVSSSLFCGGGCTIGHLKNDGTLVGSVPNPTGAGSTGVSVDADGKVWTANLNSHTATRIDPAAGPLGNDGATPVGAVDLTVSFVPAEGDNRPYPYPYNYSDMTGAQLLSSTAPQGSWTVTQDSGAAATLWGQIAWNTEPAGSTPPGTSILVEVRAAETEAGLGGQDYTAVGNGKPFQAVGRFLQVRVTLRPDAQGTSPVLSDISICSGAGGCEAAPAPPPAPAETPPADIGVSISGPSALQVGQTGVYRFEVTNAGPGKAPGATFGARLPANLTLIRWAASRGSCTEAPRSLECAIGTVEIGESLSFEIAARADSPGAAPVRGQVGTTAADWNVAANNYATEQTVVGAPFQPPAQEPGPLPPPTLGRPIGRPVQGIVLVNGVPLTAGRQLRSGDIVDVTRGRIELVSVNGVGQFFGGVFRLLERPGTTVTELVLFGGNFPRVCGHTSRRLNGPLGAETHRKKAVRRLWGNATGKFRTKGRYSSATVRGTFWLTSDRCEGTLTAVRRGSVTVFDISLRRTVVVPQFKVYLARPPRP